MKPFIPQQTFNELVPVTRFPRVNYAALVDTLRFPVIWVYEDYLQAWLPREVDLMCLRKLSNGTLDQRRLEALGLIEQPLRHWNDLKADLERDGFVIVRQLLPATYCSQLVDYFYRQPDLIERWRDMDGIKRTSMNNSPLMRLVHESTQHLARYVLGDVKTSYSFTASYETGTILPKHTDRPQCVFNASLMLGSNPSGEDLSVWPLHLKVDETVHSIGLNVGDAVFYRGTRDLHWRDEIPASLKSVLGTFLHYVPADFKGSLD